MSIRKKESLKKLKKSLNSFKKSLNSFKKRIKAQVEDEGEFDYEDFYEQLEEIEEEEDDDELEEEAGIEQEVREQFDLYSQNVDTHEWALENLEEYREWWEEKLLEKFLESSRDPKKHQVLLETNPIYRNWFYKNHPEESPEESEYEIEEQNEEESFQKQAIELATSDSQLSFEQVRELLEEQDADVLSLEELERIKEKREPTLDELVRFYDPYTEFTNTKYSKSNRALALEIAGNDEFEADQLMRVFWGYVPADVIRDQYHLGVKKVSTVDYNERLLSKKETLKNFDFDSNFLLDTLDRYDPEKQKELKKNIETLTDFREQISKSLNDIKGLLEQYSGQLESEEFKQESFQITSILTRAHEEISLLRESFPMNTEYGKELDQLAGLLGCTLNDLVEFLLNPNKSIYERATTFLDWHSNYQKGDKKFDQLFELIRRYTTLLCAKKMQSNPQLRNAPGVQNDAESLVNAVLYGIGLQHAETKNESELLDSNYNDPDYDVYISNDDVYKEKLNSISNPLARERFRNKVELHRKFKTSLNTNSAVLNKIHNHIVSLSSDSNMICPECQASWWSFQSGAYPNASSLVFNDIILPRAQKMSSEFYEKAIKVKGNILNEWRESPFRAPVGIYLRNEGQFCGALYDGANIDTVVRKIEECAKETSDLQEQAKQYIEENKHIFENDEGGSLPEFLLRGPFDPHMMTRGLVRFDQDKIARIVLPETTSQEVEQNKNQIKEALISGEPVSEFTYKRKQYLITKTQFVKLKRELEGQLCFEPRKGTSISLAELINRAVGGTIKKLMSVLPKYAKEKGILWTCPACGRRQTEPVSVSVLERTKRNNSDYELMCSNFQCPDPVHTLSEVHGVQQQVYYQSPNLSLDLSIGDETGKISDILPSDEETVREIQELEDKKEEVQEIVQKLNLFGKNNEFTIYPTGSSKLVKKVSIHNFGDIFYDIVGVGDYKKLLEMKDLELLPIAHRMGFVFPFAVCMSCGTVHPDSIKTGTFPRCIHVERLDISKAMTIEEIKTAYEESLGKNPNFPDIHKPDFDYWEKLWNEKFLSASRSGIKRYAQLEEDDEDYSILNEDLEELLEGTEEGQEAEEASPFEQLLEIPSEAEEEFTFEDLLGMDTKPEVEELEVEEVEKDISAPASIPEGDDLTEFDLLSEINNQVQQDIKKTDDKFVYQSFEEALQVLPVSERKKLWGSDIQVFSAASDIEGIEPDILAAVKKMYGIDEIVAIVDNPIGVVKKIFDDSMPELKKALKQS